MIDFTGVRKDRETQVRELAIRLRLKPREAGLLAQIDSVCDMVTGTSMIALDTLAFRTDLTTKTVIRLIRKLEAKGALVAIRRRVRTKMGTTINKPNIYKVLVPT